MVGFKDVTAPTNVRTMIASIIPLSAAGNTLPLLAPALPGRLDDQSHTHWKEAGEREFEDALSRYRRFAALLCANLNSFALDYVARQKVQGQHLNWYIVEQLPVLPEDRYAELIGRTAAAEIVREEVLKLTYTAHDMESFARDMGYGGPPFPWDEEERRHSRARLDALYFLLYGLGRADAAYILDTFPIVKREDQNAFGRYLTRDLILAYMSAFEAGDSDTQIKV